MNPPITVTVGSADPNAAPLTVNELFALLQTVISGAITGSYIPYILGSDTPSVEDQDKAWIQLDVSGRPIAIKTFFSGNWRRVYNGMLGEVRGFSGDPTLLTDWDVNGHGVVGGTYDGWQICNGMNGSPNLTDQFILGAHMDNSNGHNGYSGGWQATITGPNGVTTDYKTGGRFIETIQNNNLPILDNTGTPSGSPSTTSGPGIVLNGNEYKSDADHTPNFVPIIDVHYANLISHQINLTPTPYGKNPQDPIFTVPPFVAMGLMIFQGY